MTENSEGYRIALARIAYEAEAKTGFLDLGKLGLTQLPDELFELQHLEMLNLGFYITTDTEEWKETTGHLAGNKFEVCSQNLKELPHLKILSLRDVYINDDVFAQLLLLCKSLQNLQITGAPIADLTPLSKLTKLKKIHLDGTQVKDLSALSNLNSLQIFSCPNTPINDLTPLSKLTKLKRIYLSDTGVKDLSPLSNLKSLEYLDCSNTPISNLAPLAKLTRLKGIELSNTEVKDLSALSNLKLLESFSCLSAPISELTPLANLTKLMYIDLGNLEVKDLSALNNLKSLQIFSCRNTPINDLTPLSKLTKLKRIYLSDTGVKDLSPLSNLKSLQTFSCDNTPINDLTPLSKLTKLKEIDVSGTKVNDLSALSNLKHLERLTCDQCTLDHFPKSILFDGSLKALYVYKTKIPGIPPEVLSPNFGENCLESLRAYFSDLQVGAVEQKDAKVFILGNGQIGKTQLGRQLLNQPYDESIPSTHGIVVNSFELPAANKEHEHPAPIRFKLWDFGGQDIYLSTHALFMRTRAIFLLCWLPQSESCTQHVVNELAFRNYPLSYWHAYVKHLADAESPVIVIQMRCDQREDIVHEPPIDQQALQGIPCLHYSSKTKRGHASLQEALTEAFDKLIAKQGTIQIGRGRVRVQQQLEQWQNQNAFLPVQQRQYRTLSREDFQRLCDEGHGDVSSAEQLLQYLHNIGAVFYQPGLFNDQIIVDQGWALQAIYALFDREGCYQSLRQLHGRFTRALLEKLIWQDHTAEEQVLFLSMMQSCGICFVHQPADELNGIEARYIAPDLLPDRQEIEVSLEDNWPSDAVIEQKTLTYAFYHSGLLRSLMAELGEQAGINAEYWKDGLYFYESTTRSRALIEQSFQDNWQGSITIKTQGNQARDLLTKLLERLQQQETRWGLKHIDGDTVESVNFKGAQKLSADDIPNTKLTIIQEPIDQPEYCVSYAWKDATVEGKQREAVVDQFCSKAEQLGIRIIRDKTALGLGENITKFMQRIGRADRIFVFLSEKYLKSSYCMFELYEIWRNSRLDEDEFMQRVKVYTLPDTPIDTTLQRAQCADYWISQKNELEPLVARLGEKDFKQYRLMQDFAHHVSDILATIAEHIQPRNFDELVNYGFSDLPGTQKQL